MKRFMISDIVEDSGSKRARSESPDRVQLLDSFTVRNRWIKTDRHTVTFTIKNLEESRDPERTIEDAFQRIIDTAVQEASVHTGVPDRIGLDVFSSNLDYPIWIPINHISNDNVKEILRRIDHINQSARRGSIYGAPIRIEVTLICKEQLEQDIAAGNVVRELPTAGRKPKKFYEFELTTIEDGLIKINNNDRLCLFYAAELGRLKHILNPSQFHRYRINTEQQRENIHNILDQLKISSELPSYDLQEYLPQIQHYFDMRSPGEFRINVFTKYSNLKPILKTGPLFAPNNIDLYYNQGHIDLITSLRIFFNFNSKKYCYYCESTFQHVLNHTMKCDGLCVPCRSYGKPPCVPDGSGKKKCNDCGQIFSSQLCYEQHITNGACERFRTCEMCGITWDKERADRGEIPSHRCDERFCSRCETYHTVRKGCNLKKLFPPKKAQIYRLVAFDFECSQNTIVDGHRKHVVTFAAMQITCTMCMDENNTPEEECVICGPNKIITFSAFEFDDQSVTNLHIVTDDPLEGFMTYLMNYFEHKAETYLFSHNGGRYDMGLVYEALLKMDIVCLPSVIRQGTRFYNITIPATKTSPHLEFKDSYNFIPIALGKFSETFGIEEMQKGYFPHLFNTRENIMCPTLPCLPHPSNYFVNSMSIGARRKFLDWYQSNKNQPFSLTEQLSRYCVSDVKLLMSGLVFFRNLFLKESNFEALKRCNTMASVVLTDFQMNSMQPGSIAIASELSYEIHHKQSTIGKKYLAWFAYKHQVPVRTADSEGGEKRLSCGYLLDGFVEGGLDGNGKSLGLEVMGCCWHGCSSCFEDDQVLPTGRTAAFERERTERRLERIRKENIEVMSIWTCQIERLLETDREMKKFFDEALDLGPIRLRDSYFGGRTAPLKLYAKKADGYKIGYKDFCSLYPATQVSTAYPIGHPELKIFQKKVKWTSSADNPLRGIIKCFVIPPSNLRLPVLPKKLPSGRLIFTLCNQCSLDHPNGLQDDSYRCGHNDLQRGWISTATHLELNYALERGYRVTYLARALVWDKWDDSIFKPFVNKFIRLKIQSSGFPPHASTEDQKEAFITAYRNRGIFLQKDQIVKNNGKKFVAKRANNSLWGRLSLRNGLARNEIVDDPAQYITLFNDHRVEIQRVEPIRPGLAVVVHRQKANFVEENPTTNIVISIYTTSAARLKLLASMETVIEKGGEVIYTDTDSVLYRFLEENGDPLPDGCHLGELIDEVPPGDEIVEVVSGGAKQIAFKIRRADGSFYYIIKIRGITLNYDAYRRFCDNDDVDDDESSSGESDYEADYDDDELQENAYENFKKLVLSHFENGEENSPIAPLIFNFKQIRPQRNGSILTTQIKKRYKPIITSNVVNSDFNIYPFGYNK